MRSTGETIFVDEYQQDAFNIPLVSGFISAIFSFMERGLHTTDIFSIDVALLRFIFASSEIGKFSYYFVLLCQRIDTLGEYQPKLNTVKDKFIEMYHDELISWKGGNTAIFDPFRKIQRQLFEIPFVTITSQLKEKLHQKVTSITSTTDNLYGIALLTHTGTVIVSTLETNTLIKVIQILEGRYYSGAKTIDQLVSKEEEGILILIGGDMVISAAVFDKVTPLGESLMDSKILSESINNIIYEDQ
jgi:hypothetical protein